MQVKVRIMSIFLATLALSSCAQFFPQQNNKHLPSQQKICTQLRHNIIYQNNTTGPNMVQGTPINEARNMQQYQYYNCDAFEPGGNAITQ